MEKIKYKVAFLTPAFKGGGAERNILNIANNISENFQVFILAGEICPVFGKKVKNTVNLISLKSRCVFSLLIKLIIYLKKEKPDILVSALPHINVISVLAKFLSRSKTKIILTEHSIFSLVPKTARSIFRAFVAKFILPFLMAFFYPKADAVICVSNAVLNDLSPFIRRTENCSVIYNAVADDSIFELMSEKVEHIWFSENEKKPVIIAVGRLIKAKDYPTLLAAFKMVISKHQANLVILGEGDERKNIEKLILSLNISKNVALLGFKDNPYKYMKKSSVFVLSSVREGFGNCVIEAMACGVPVVSTECSGPKEIIQNHENGILVPIKNATMLCEAILEVLENQNLALKLSLSGKKRAQNFTVEKSVKQYENIFFSFFGI